MVAVGGLGLRVGCPELLLALLEAVDRSLALICVSLRYGAVEDQPTHPAGVGLCQPRRRHARLAAQRGVEGAQAGADAGVAEVDAGRVVPEIGTHGWWGGLEPGEGAEACHLAFRVDEEGVVVGDDAALGRDLVEHRGVVALPQGQAQGVGVLIAALERQRHLEWVAHADDEAQVRFEIEPVRGGEARAWVLEAPVVVFTERRQGGGAGLRHVRHPRVVHRRRRQQGRVVPRASGGLEQRVVAGHDGLVLPEALGVVVRGVDELLGAGPDEVEPRVVEGAGDHRGAGPVHPSDGNRDLVRHPPVLSQVGIGW
jgi:hypothetical protein